MAPSADLTLPVPLTIGVLADTHIYPGGRRRLPSEVSTLFRRARVNLITHAGDVNDRSLLTELAEIAPVLAVVGNNDSAELREQLPDQIGFRAGRFSFMLVHGHQGRTARTVARTFVGKVDCVIYGHSHIPMIETSSNTTLFNPGSPTDRRWQPHFGIGLIHVSAEHCRPELLLFDDPSHLDRIDVSAKTYTDDGAGAGHRPGE